MCYHVARASMKCKAFLRTNVALLIPVSSSPTVPLFMILAGVHRFDRRVATSAPQRQSSEGLQMVVIGHGDTAYRNLIEIDVVRANGINHFIHRYKVCRSPLIACFLFSFSFLFFPLLRNLFSKPQRVCHSQASSSSRCEERWVCTPAKSLISHLFSFFAVYCCKCAYLFVYEY